MAKNIVLIGMPGTGKTTVGNELSIKTGMGFVDTDDFVKDACQMALKDFVAENGMEAFLELQRSVIKQMEHTNYVVATGGGVVLDSETMGSLSKNGNIVYLDTSVDTLESRLAPERRLARKSGETFRDVFIKREPLYKKYSSFSVDCNDKEVTQIADEIMELLNEGRER